MSDFRKRLAAIDPQRLFGAATDTELLVDIGYNHLKGDDRRSCAGAIRRERLPLAKRMALEGIRDVQHYRKLWKDQCAKVEAAEARALESLAGMKRERALLGRACDERDAARARELGAEHAAEMAVTLNGDLLEALGRCAAMVGGQDGDDLEARLRYALAVGGARPGETLIDAGARASAERDDLRAELDACALELSIRQTRGDGYQRRAVEAERDRAELQAELALARRSWWRRLLDWWSL